MNELQTQSQQLPDTLEDLTQFVLVGKAKLQAYMLKLQTVNRLSVAQEIRDQTLQEAQEISTALIAAEQRIGEILLSIPKASGGDRKSDDFKNGNSANFEKTKSETASEMGYSHNEVRDYQQMAKNPEIVQKVIEEAIANGEIVTKSQVMKEIKTERDKAKAEMQDLREERDYLQSQVEELQNAEPQVIERTIEVVPDDYEEIKEKMSLYKTQAKSAEESRKRASAEYREKLREANDRIKDLEERKGIDELQKKLEEETEFFAIRTYDYIQKNGGYVWITERMDRLPKDKRKTFISTIYAIDAFAKQMVNNIGGYGVE